MSTPSITVTIDGRTLTQDDIHAIEFERIKHVFRDMSALGAQLHDATGADMTLEQALALPFAKAKEALVVTKVRLGREGILNLYKDRLAQSDEMWHRIAAETVKGRNMQPAYVEVDVDGVTIGDFIAYNRALNKNGDTTAPFYIHPEHFVFEAKDGGQYVMETVGEYQEPTFQFLYLGPNPTKPVEEDADTTISIAGDTAWLVSDHTYLPIMGIHQFKAKKGGMRAKLGIFFPENAPIEMVNGHKEHLAVEFSNALTYAARKKSIMSPVFNAVVILKKALTRK